MKEIKLYNKKIIIKFDEARHIFYGIDGKVLISVTAATVINHKSGPLMGWAVKSMGEYIMSHWEEKNIKTNLDMAFLVDNAKREYRIRKKKAADIGTLIHEWVSNWILGKNPEMPDNDKVVNGITAFLKFQKEHKAKWIESERYVYSKKYKFAGIMDAVAKIDGEMVLVDFKSSNGIYDEMKFQVAGYQIAYEEEMEKKMDKRVIIRFGKEDGEFEMKILDEDEKDKKAFLYCLGVKRRLKEFAKYGR